MNDSFFIFYSTVPYSVRVDTALKWLNGSAGVYPDLVVLYFSKVDEGGHEGGPGSLQVSSTSCSLPVLPRAANLLES